MLRRPILFSFRRFRRGIIEDASLSVLSVCPVADRSEEGEENITKLNLRYEGVTVRSMSLEGTWLLHEFRAAAFGRRQWERKRKPVGRTTLLRLIHEHADAVPVGIRASGAPLTRWTSASRGPVRRGSLISKTANWFVQFSPLYDCTGVGRPRLDPKRGGPPVP